MAAQLDGVLVNNLQEFIRKSKILVVGAGGIGCEILKNLVLSGFPDIEVIDLDTIDVSNLNRQFLFHKEHVGKSKAEVARQSALAFNPNVQITAYHDSITTQKYGVNFFKKFNLVLNALDNRQARNHVNRMCLTADVPLIESGTAGYIGQVEFIKKGMTLCYECTPKAAQKTFPGCTIRNTPSEPIHCIVWAKHLFNQLFGETNEDEEVSPDMADPEAGGDNAGEAALNSKHDENGKGDIERVNTRQWAKNLNYDADKLFNKFFHDDIKYLLSMSNLWKNRSPPQPIKRGEFPEESTNQTTNNASVLPDQRIWSLEECYKIFSDSVGALKSDIEKLEENDHLVWDKDDKSAMDFVAACANIRSKIFNIPVKSRFDIKSMAGNIIPAIATTNAITAGVVVMHAFKALAGEYEKCKSVYMRNTLNPQNYLLAPEKMIQPPNPKCYVCAPKPQVCLQVDTSKLTVKELRDDVLIKTLNMIDPDVMLESKGLIVISSEEGETDCNNNKKLDELYIVDGVELKVDDFLQQYELSVLIFHAEAERDKPLFEIIGDRDAIKEKKTDEEEDAPPTEKPKEDGADDGPSPSKKQRVEVQDADEEDDDDLLLIEDDETEDATAAAPSTSNATNLKRKPADNVAGEGCSKKAKIDDSDDDLIMIEEDD